MFGSELHKKITLNIEQMPLGDVLKKIEHKSDITFTYSSAVIEKNRPVTASFSQVSIEDILKILLYDDGSKYTVIGNQVILFKEESQKKQLIQDALPPVRDTIWTNVVNTVFVNDTNYFDVFDTITVYDTVEVRVVSKVKTKLTHRKKNDVISMFYSPQYNSLRFDIPDNKYFKITSAYQVSHQLDFLYGKTSKYVEIASGLGICLVNQNIEIKHDVYNSYYDPKSSMFINSWSDSSAIVIPNMDSVWIVEQYSDTIQLFDSIFVETRKDKSLKNTNNLLYLTLPIHFAFKLSLDRKTMVFASADIYTRFLLNSSYKALQYDNPDCRYLQSLKPEKVYVSGNISVGLEYEFQKNISVCIAPNVGFRFSQMLTDNGFVPRNNMQVGLSLGIKGYF